MLKNLVFAVIALLLGFVGLNFIFSDLSSSEAWINRTLTAAVFFFFSGLVIGGFNPQAWFLSGLTAWGGLLMGAIITLNAVGKYGSNAFGAQEPPYISAGLVFLFVPLAVALFGGWLGKLLNEKFRSS